jgi:ABC-type nitrate/sulfonate/bicarbonate transport system substrate-binding protein
MVGPDVILAIAAVAAAIYYYERPSVLRIAVPRDSDDQAIMAATAHDFAEARDGIRLKLVAVESLAESSCALQEGHADLAVVRSDLAMPPNGQTVLIMRRDAAVLLAPAESNLRAIDDLRGHKVGVLQGADFIYRVSRCPKGRAAVALTSRLRRSSSSR